MRLPGPSPPRAAGSSTAQDLVLTPGLIDMHVHLREPGEEYKETIETGTRAAVRGGFTAVACMPNTRPVNDNTAVTRFILEQASGGGAGPGLSGGRPSPWALWASTLSEYGDQKEAGAVAVSDDGRPVMSPMLMRRALEYARTFESARHLPRRGPGTSGRNGVMHEGRVSLELGLKGIPAAVEEVMIFRDLTLAGLTGGRLHIAHVSTAGSVELYPPGQGRGPAGDRRDRAPLLQPDRRGGLRLRHQRQGQPAAPHRRGPGRHQSGPPDGTLDAIACDHAPHTSLEKDLEFEAAAFGLIGLETSLGLSLKLVHDGVLTLSQLVTAMSLNPARILGVPGGTLAVGAPADLTLIDLNRNWTVDANTFASKSRNCPFHGWTLQGKAVMTMVGGRWCGRKSRRSGAVQDVFKVGRLKPDEPFLEA